MIRLAAWVLYSSLPPAYLCDHHGRALRAQHPNIDLRYLAGKSRLSCDLCFAQPVAKLWNQPTNNVEQRRKVAA